jgi:hypothetical protein
MNSAILSGGIAGMFLTIINILVYTWPFLLLAIIITNKVTWKRYPLEAVILEKKGDNLIKTNDRVGKFYDKHGDMIFYKLAKCGDTIPVYNFDWVLHNVSVPTNILEKYINIIRGNSGTIFLFRYGSKQYKPINIKPGNGSSKKFVASKGKNGEPVYSYQYIQFDPRKVIGTLDFEVIDWDNMNFMIQEQRASIIRRQKKSEFWKQTLIPLTIIGAAVVISIFILKFSLDAGKSIQGAASSGGSSSEGGSKIGNAIGSVANPGE